MSDCIVCQETIFAEDNAAIREFATNSKIAVHPELCLECHEDYVRAKDGTIHTVITWAATRARETAQEKIRAALGL
jgi:hypothetical protein